MFKNMKLLLVLFAFIIMIFTGCSSDNSMAFKKGDNYKRTDRPLFVEVQADNEWKMHKGSDRADKYAVYKLEETEYKAGKYTVFTISLKAKFGSDPLLLSNGDEKLLVSPTENGFSTTTVGINSNDSWKDFQKDFKAADDKEDFLKKISESKNKTNKYEKVN
ncbi:DUF5512 family protein [Bacillus mycoides]|uniref:DUF5512 family protein n=1 Tax=Bacillus mycoides TaxID=1405 RepID=A0A4U3A8S6_BACMY|nr:DUF5512 family protein [Bacillus mycoides]QWH03971.1 hypothetical protein EXW52_27900 [Bacillus mycoides]TKI84147.1 hypothetical protein FC701_15050 [Bacillus mycoides]